MADFHIKRHDLLPVIEAQLLDHDGAVVDLTGATVKFLMQPLQGGAVKVAAAAAIEDAEQGIVRYVWVGTDTDKMGSYLAEWEVTYFGGKKQTFPNDGYTVIQIQKDIDDG